MTATKRPSKPARLADEIEAAGWAVQRIKRGELREIHASRGDELVSITFVRKHFGGTVQSDRDVFVQAKHYSGVGDHGGTDVSTAAEAMRIIRAQPAVPFAMDAPDAEVLAAVAGKVVEWRNATSGRTESAEAPRGGVHLKLTHPSVPGFESGERLLSFPDSNGWGFRTVRLNAITRVK